MNLTELMQQHILESQQMDDICQIMEDIFIANSKNSRVFEYILEHGLSAEIETTYNDINYCIFVTPKPVEKQLYPHRPRHAVLSIWVSGEELFQVTIGFDQYQSFFVKYKLVDIDKDVLEHCLNALFD
jgi:hypothetical protein